MKILWVEDFGVKLTRLTIIIEIFKELFEHVDLSRVYNSDNPDVAGQLSGLFEEHTLHHIYVCRSYSEWKKMDELHGGDFDIALIDINLESHATPRDEMPEGIENSDFDKMAGFYIYHQLIRRGFPDDNIAFFTGQEQSLKSFARYCGDIFLDRPKHCFEKNPTQFQRLREWLNEKANQPSLILRRGVIEGCRFMKEKVEAVDGSELESHLLFYKTTPRHSSGGPEAFRQETIDYLTRLERFFLPHHAYDKVEFYNLFLKELADKWEESRGYFIRSKEAPQFSTWLEELFHKTAQLQMKLLRNWTSHGLISPCPTAKEIAYFFMVAMRSWVATDLGEVLRYEKLLSTLFRKLSDLELNRLLNAGLEVYLEQSYEQLKALHTDVLRYAREDSEEKRVARNINRRIDNYFLAIFRELGEAVERLEPSVVEFYKGRMKDASLTLFYQSFWHGLFPLRIKTIFYANLQSVEFNLEPFSLPFLSFLGQSIFKDCFKKEDVSVNVA